MTKEKLKLYEYNDTISFSTIIYNSIIKIYDINVTTWRRQAA